MTTTAATDFHSAENRFYVYALSSTPVDQSETFDPSSIFYVGKGTGKRWESHFTEAQQEIARLADETEQELPAKFAAIRGIIEEAEGNLDFENYVYIVKGGLEEKNAFLLEALTIELLAKAGVALTNLVRGHHSADLLKPAGEVRRYYGAEPLAVDRILAKDVGAFLPGGERDDEILCIAVKGSIADMDLREDVPWGEENDETRFAGGVAYTVSSTAVEGGRRGWDPDDPWTDEEARERARHYWNISPRNVELLQEISRDGRLELVLLIQDPRAGQSTIRYHWKIDADGEWIDYWHYLDDEHVWHATQVGLPLGEKFEEAEDPLLGRTPRRVEDGRQLLEAMASGIGYFALHSTGEPAVAEIRP